jgi:hypothetical protein
MANIVKELQINSFVKGLITEASPLTFPANASLDEENFVLNLDGSRWRRLGLDYESGYAFTNTTYNDATMAVNKIQVFYWPSPGGSTTVSLAVVRIKDKLYFVNLLATSPSNAILTSITFGSTLNPDRIQMAIINNILVCTSQSAIFTPFYCVWDVTANTVTSTPLYLKIRDFYGIYENYALDHRLTNLEYINGGVGIHSYNLQNQGWNTKLEAISGVGVSPAQEVFNIPNPTTDPATGLPYAAGWPSNADIMYLGKVNSQAIAANYEKFSALVMYKNSYDNIQAPKGHFIIDYRTRGSARANASNQTLPTEGDYGIVQCVASYSGRAFYSGVVSSLYQSDTNSPNYGGYVFFSQIVDNPSSLGKCYQENDPTSPHISDILDTDGGTIHIPEATRIIKLVSHGPSLLVFAENGVWEVTGDNGIFKATSYQVNKISNIGTDSPDSIVEGGGQLVYWSNSGIYAIIAEPTTGRLAVQNIILNTIQSYYNNLSATCKQYVKGMFDERKNTFRWLFNDTATYSTTNYINKYNKQMNLDLNLKAFYVYNMGDTSTTTSPYVADFIKIPNYSSSSTVSRVEPYSLLTIKNGTFTISKYSSTKFKDWYTNDSIGVDYSSYLVTGHEIFGDISHSKQIPYINFYFDRTETYFLTGWILDFPSSCLVQAQWDWCNSANSGKWGAQFQAYRLLRNYIPDGSLPFPVTFNYGERVIVTKNKLRGSGRALSLKILSEAGKDMKLLGWSSDVTVKPKV